MNTPTPENDPVDDARSGHRSPMPRREFMKFAGTLSTAAAAGIYLTTDARGRAHAPAPLVPEDHIDPAHLYSY